ncbi:unnamed protein product [Porites evermanni]|uniref:Uncharacterized protein n=1 Tax=Porites evermanni TaxID=104178 RepID=A0ABN8QI84_9CNID|nr:unnamed protein product [Porites evermanni]
MARLNRPFPSSPGPLIQNEGRCSAFDMEIIFHSHANKTHFHKKDMHSISPNKYADGRINSLGVPYDYDTFSINGRTTIGGKNGDTRLGNSRGLSPKDIQQPRLLYCGNRPVVTRPPTRPPTGKVYG